MPYEVLTSPLALVKIAGATVGKMRNVRVTEQFSRGRVVGIGELIASELPILGWQGSMSCSLYAIKTNAGVFSAIDRSGTNIQAFVESVLFNEGIQVDILMKRKAGNDPTTGRPIIELTTFASVKGVQLISEGFDISEGQISGRDGSFEYTTPMLYG